MIKTNHNVGNTPCRVFEIADTYIPAEAGKLPIEKTRLTITCDSDFRDIKGVVDGLLKTIAADAVVKFEPAEISWAQAGVKVIANNKQVGVVGMASQQVLDKIRFQEHNNLRSGIRPRRITCASCRLNKSKTITEIPRDKTRPVINCKRGRPLGGYRSRLFIRKAPAELEELQFVDIFRGKSIPQGKKSVTLSLWFRDADGTLTHEAVDGFQADILKSLTESLGAELRTA